MLYLIFFCEALKHSLSTRTHFLIRVENTDYYAINYFKCLDHRLKWIMLMVKVLVFKSFGSNALLWCVIIKVPFY